VNLDTELQHSFTKINSKWITDLNIKHKATKLLKDNIEYLEDFGYGDDFLDMMTKTQSIKGRMDKLNLIKIKTSVL